ncbi:MAG TPA: urea ABC transporter permease subunit UrtB, partial [Polyangiaceae bacterium]
MTVNAIVAVLGMLIVTLWVVSAWAETALPTPGASIELETAVKLLSSSDSEEQQSGVRRLAALDDARSTQILSALRDGHLGFDEGRNLWIASGNLQHRAIDGISGTPQGRVQRVISDNQIRRLLDEALVRLRLRSSNIAERRSAASEVAHSPDVQSVAVVRELIAQEPDRKTKQWMDIAVAKYDITSPEPQLRIHAANVLGGSNDISMREQLQAQLGTNPDGRPREPDPEVRKAISSAAAAIAWRELEIRTLANLIYGLSLGSVLLLAALGLAITFGLMKVINMAHGEMLMLGAYATYVAQGLFQRYAPTLLGYYLVAAVPLAFVTTAVVGLVLERVVVRRLYGRPLETLLATWGLSLMLIQSVRTLFGAQNVSVATPDWLSGGWELMPTVVVPYSRMLVLAFTASVVTFVWFVLRRSSLGLKLRAVTQNREMAAALGIHTERVDAWTFALGSGVAGLGGVALSQLGNVGPELGQQHIIDSFMVVVL